MLITNRVGKSDNYAFWPVNICYELSESTVAKIEENISVSYTHLVGALFSSVVMSLAVRLLMPPFSLIGVSEWGALAHNIGQLCVASVTLQNSAIFVYLPIMTLAGLFTGFFVGLSANVLSPSLRRAVQGQREGRIHDQQKAREDFK